MYAFFGHQVSKGGDLGVPQDSSDQDEFMDCWLLAQEKPTQALQVFWGIFGEIDDITEAGQADLSRHFA